MSTKKFLSDIASSVGRQTLGFIRGIVIIPLITQVLGIAQFGIWTTLMGIVSIVAGISSLNLPLALVRYVPEEDQDGQTFVDLLAMSLITSVLIAGSVILLFQLFPSLLAGIGDSVATALGLVVFARGIEALALNYPRALNQVKIHEVMKSLQILCETVGLIAVFLLFESIRAGLLVIAGVSIIITLAILLYFLPRRPPRPNMSNFRDYLAFSLPIVPKNLSSRVIRNTDKFLILYFVGPAGAGIYGVASTVGKMLENMLQVVNPTLYPTVVEEWGEENTRDLKILYDRLFRGFVLFGVPAISGVALLAEDIVTVLASSSIVGEATAPIVIMSIAYFIIGLSGPFAFILYGAEKTVFFIRIYIGGAALNVVLNMLMIPVYETFGAVIATTVTYILLTTIIVAYASTEVPFTIPVASFSRAIVGAGVMISMLIVLPSSLSTITRLVTYPLIGVIVYSLVVVMLGEITQEERQFIYSTANELL